MYFQDEGSKKRRAVRGQDDGQSFMLSPFTTASYFSNRLRYDNIGLLRICHLSFTLGYHGNSNRIAQEILLDLLQLL